MAAVMLTTGTTGSEGTLGGLVEEGRRLRNHLREAWDLGRGGRLPRLPLIEDASYLAGQWLRLIEAGIVGEYLESIIPPDAQE